jgi:hypothetical protein
MRLEAVELVPQANHPLPDVLAMALDDPASVVGRRVGDRDANLAERADRHRPDPLRVPGGTDRFDAMAIEQREHDAGFDIRRSDEHHDH